MKVSSYPVGYRDHFYPAYSLWLIHSLGPELGIFLEPLSLDKKDVTILAVNDNSSLENAGGSHW